MDKFTVIHNSSPISPMKSVKLSKTWRLAWVNVTLAKAKSLIADQPSFAQGSYKIIPSDQVSNYI